MESKPVSRDRGGGQRGGSLRRDPAEPRVQGIDDVRAHSVPEGRQPAVYRHGDGAAIVHQRDQLQHRAPAGARSRGLREGAERPHGTHGRGDPGRRPVRAAPETPALAPAEDAARQQQQRQREDSEPLEQQPHQDRQEPDQPGTVASQRRRPVARRRRRTFPYLLVLVDPAPVA